MLDHSKPLDKIFHWSSVKLLFPLHVLFLQPNPKTVLGCSAESNNKCVIDITPHEWPLSFSLLMGWKLLRWKRYALISLQVTMTTAGSKKETQICLFIKMSDVGLMVCYWLASTFFFSFFFLYVERIIFSQLIFNYLERKMLTKSLGCYCKGLIKTRHSGIDWTSWELIQHTEKGYIVKKKTDAFVFRSCKHLCFSMLTFLADVSFLFYHRNRR